MHDVASVMHDCAINLHSIAKMTVCTHDFSHVTSVSIIFRIVHPYRTIHLLNDYCTMGGRSSLVCESFSTDLRIYGMSQKNVNTSTLPYPTLP